MANEDPKHPHVNMARPIRIYLSSGDHVDAKMVDLSEDGVGIEYPAPADANTELELYMELPAQNGVRGFRFKGVVKNSRVCHGNFCIGLDFKTINEEDKEFVMRYISDRLSH